MSIAYLGLGANLGDVAETLQQAVRMISCSDGLRLLAVSRLYRTKPVGGPSGQPDYLNAAAAVECIYGPRALLNQCLAIERKLGRVRLEHWGARTIDVDILAFDGLTVDEPDLTVPHPQLRSRLFALLPLLDITPKGFQLPPDGRKLRQIVDEALDDLAFADQLPLEAIEIGVEFPVQRSENRDERVF